MPELEQQLIELGRALDWPATPRLTIPVPARRDGLQWRRWFYLPSPWGRPLAVAVAALLIVALALIAYTPSRDAIAEWIDLHVNIQRVQNPPTPTILPSGQLGEFLGLGLPTTLEGAQQQVSWKITVPSALGTPDAVYVKHPPPDGEVTLVYGRAPGIPVAGETGVSVLVTEVRGRVNESYFEKFIGPNTSIEQVSIGGRVGYWIAGHPHDFVFTGPDGEPIFDSLRLATNTLLFDDHGVLVRIEANTTKDRAIQIANSLPAR